VVYSSSQPRRDEMFQVVRKRAGWDRKFLSSKVGRPVRDRALADRMAMFMSQEETEDDVWYEVEEVRP
jgi:hypothetical protein